ncbi:hypothetical protein FACS189481_6150 [Clostridia bacterium]|nr:hypothetical protein FACS189481_6150 [Clostridia bacterium]
MPTAEEERRAAANAAAACFCPVAEWAVNAVHSVPRVVSPPYEAVAKNSDEILDKLQAAMQGMDLSLARIDQFLKANSSFVGTNAQARASAEDLKVNHGRARAELKRALADGLRITDAQDDTAAVCVSYANDLRRAASRWKKVSKALWGPAIRASWFALISALGGVFQLEVESETSYAADELARAGLAGGLAAPTGPNWSGATQPLPLGPFHLQEEPRPASEVRPENVVEREKQLPPGFRWHTGTAETPTLRIVPLPSTAVLPSHYILKAVCSAGGDITIFPAHGTPGSICEIPVDVAQQKPVTIVIKRHLGYNLEAIRVDKQYFPSVFLGITTGNAVTFNFPLPGEGPITHDTDIEVEFATQASAHTWQHNTVSNIVPSG